MLLTNLGISTGLYTGSVSARQREDTLEGFESPCIQVILLSKGAGGTGLNLKADELILLNPGENQSLDDQVKSRIIRMGQTHHVHIHNLLLPHMDNHMWNRKKQKLAMASLFVKDECKTLQRLYNCSISDINTMIANHRVRIPAKPARKPANVLTNLGKRRVPDTDYAPNGTLSFSYMCMCVSFV